MNLNGLKRQEVIEPGCFMVQWRNMSYQELINLDIGDIIIIIIIKTAATGDI